MRLFAPFMASTRLAFPCKSPIRFAISIRYNWTQAIVSLEGEVAVGLGVKVEVEVSVQFKVLALRSAFLCPDEGNIKIALWNADQLSVALLHV